METHVLFLVNVTHDPSEPNDTLPFYPPADIPCGPSGVLEHFHVCVTRLSLRH